MALQDDINNFTSANTVADLLTLSAQTANTTTNRTVSVANTASLPDLSLNTVDPGTVIFVESLGIPVVAQVGCWTGLDNRELRSDTNIGIALAWGSSNFGATGLNLFAGQTTSPRAVVGGFLDWCQVSAGNRNGFGIRTNGTLWAWGENSVGQLGNGSCGTNVSSPVSVIGGFTDWCFVDTNKFNIPCCPCHFAVGIRTNGTLWAWGANGFGTLGNGTQTNRSSPVSVVGGFTDWCQAAAGCIHTLGVRTNGSLWAWGNNSGGKLGDGTTTNRCSPVSVAGGFTDWCQSAAATNHSLGVRTNGSLWAWGINTFGQLGDNTTTTKSSPVSVVGGFTDWCSVSASAYHSVAIRTNGTLWSWGYNGQGRLGDGTSTTKSSPVSVVGGFTDWCRVNAGARHTLAIRTNGTAWGWGNGGYVQLGNGVYANQCSPSSFAGGFTDWRQVSGGYIHSLGIRTF